MPTTLRLMLTLAVMSFLMALPVTAETPEQTRIKALEEENAALRMELAQLRLELSQIKREREDDAKTKPAGDADQGDKLEQSDDETDKAEDGDTEAVRTYRSADEIFRSIPQQFKPVREGWTAVEKKAVAEWLVEHIPGSEFKSKKKISSMTLRRAAFSDDPWQVRLGFEYEPMRYMNWGINEQIAYVTLTGDDDFAERAPKMFREGKTVLVQGVIKQTRWDSFVIQKAGERWHPSFFEITLEGVRVE